MKKLIPIVFLILLFLFVACSPEPSYPTEPKPQKLSDPRFNGEFVYSCFWEDSKGLEEKNEYYSYEFDGSTKCEEWYKYKNYSSTSGWTISSDYPDFNYFEFEIQVNESKTMFRTKLWNNQYSDWGEWKKYEFLDNGTVLRIYPFPDDFPSSYKDYIKK